LNKEAQNHKIKFLKNCLLNLPEQNECQLKLRRIRESLTRNKRFLNRLFGKWYVERATAGLINRPLKTAIKATNFDSLAIRKLFATKKWYLRQTTRLAKMESRKLNIAFAAIIKPIEPNRLFYLGLKIKSEI